jgi:hypothetical protein
MVDECGGVDGDWEWKEEERSNKLYMTKDELKCAVAAQHVKCELPYFSPRAVPRLPRDS